MRKTCSRKPSKTTEIMLLIATFLLLFILIALIFRGIAYAEAKKNRRTLNPYTYETEE